MEYSSLSRVGRTRALIDLAIFLAGVCVVAVLTSFFLDLKSTAAALILVTAVFVISWSLLRGSGQTWKDMGLRRPARLLWLPVRVVFIYGSTMAIGIVAQLLLANLIEPPDLGRFATLYHNLPMLLGSLASIWVTAAFFEELVFRGFVLNRLIAIFDSSRWGLVAAVLIQAVLFGVVHFYQGVAGVILTGLVGALFAVFFLVQKRNLWALIITHGLIDTLGLVRFFFVDAATLAQ